MGEAYVPLICGSLGTHRCEVNRFQASDQVAQQAAFSSLQNEVLLQGN